MKTFLEGIKQFDANKEISDIYKNKSGVITITGCLDAGKPHLAYALDNDKKYKIIVLSEEQKAKEFYENYKFFDEDVVYYPAKDILFYQSDIRGNLLTEERINALKTIRNCEKCTLVTTYDALMNTVASKKMMIDTVIKLHPEDEISIDELVKELVQLGYEKNYQVDAKGQFALRGGILDIYPLTESNPIRIEMWGDEIDTIRSFDIQSQRSIEVLEEAEIFPATEIVLNKEELERGIKKIKKDASLQIEKLRKQMKTEEAFRLKSHIDEAIEEWENQINLNGIETYLSYFCEEKTSLLDYFEKEDTVIFFDELHRCIERGKLTEQEFSLSMENRLAKGYILPKQIEELFPYKQVNAKLNKYKIIALAMLDNKTYGFDFVDEYNVNIKSISSYNNSFELLMKELIKFKEKKYKIVLLSPSRTRAKRLANDLRDNDIDCFYSEDKNKELQNGELMVTNGSLHSGFEYSDFKFVIITEIDIFGKKTKKKKKKSNYEGENIQSFSDLHIGDYVVHENHGLGIYRGIEKIEVDQKVKDYIKIEYAGNSNLYILATQLEIIQKYAGKDARKPKLNKLGSQEWNKTKSRVKKSVKIIAEDLVRLYAKRSKESGYAYGEDTIWQKEFEELFPYEETTDQELAIEETKKDMESTKIMDRLICGDVGYGKTEIAIRAAFKAVQEGKQVAYLVPTTILAQQHYNNFVQRMKEFPINIASLSRFRSKKEQDKTIEGLKSGLVDIVIGTHRILSKDVQFKDLGLLIIDEEQRFGVAHKEKIKQMKENVDVLTLTATPIPRTLHMSLIGIRDMSVLEEPPVDRIPIQTYVTEYDEEMVREAINRELARGGQVYYVYNQVKDIDEVADRLQQLLPDANVAFAHGKMKVTELENIMYDFINGDIDVLVSTTIIETGLDIANVNTMIIEAAENLGLSQLYQLRGRVGRSNRTSYAFLMYKKNKMLKEVAEKRLAAMKEYSDLGSGFKIAMRDLEIRGAGNLLGEQQSGHMEAIGYDLYCKLLNEAVKEAKGEKVEESFETSIDIEENAFIPDTYIANEFQKLEIYKRIASTISEEEADEILEELIDRFGEPPVVVQNLLKIARLKILAHKLYIVEIVQRANIIKLKMHEKAKINPANIPQVIQMYQNKMRFVKDPKAVYFEYVLPKPQNTIAMMRRRPNAIAKNLPKKQSNDTISTLEKLLNDMVKILIE
ncbi:transcription-repair coupling factor [Lachnobacterium bovis]|uniref:transcription-repair coupling factor n=1 Tax=Lachnobacterium bovis TaxID=140626 RepID=UPI0004867929|nr:transcription-repair coupling factor [Lachnobacterium bovis]